MTYGTLCPVIDVLTPSDSDWVHELHPAFGLAETLKYCPSLPDFQGRLVAICEGIGRDDLAAIAKEASEAALHDYMIDLKATLPN